MELELSMGQLASSKIANFSSSLRGTRGTSEVDARLHTTVSFDILKFIRTSPSFLSINLATNFQNSLGTSQSHLAISQINTLLVY